MTYRNHCGPVSELGRSAVPGGSGRSRLSHAGAAEETRVPLPEGATWRSLAFLLISEDVNHGVAGDTAAHRGG